MFPVNVQQNGFLNPESIKDALRYKNPGGGMCKFAGVYYFFFCDNLEELCDDENEKNKNTLC